MVRVANAKMDKKRLDFSSFRLNFPTIEPKFIQIFFPKMLFSFAIMLDFFMGLNYISRIVAKLPTIRE